MRLLFPASLALIGLLIGVSGANAQWIHSPTPFQTFNDNYSQGGSVHWSVNGPHGVTHFGGNGPLAPPFGGGPAGVSGGIGFGGIGLGGGGVSGGLGFNFGQFSSRSISSTTSSLTVTDGVPGSIQSTIIRPFVTGFTPIVGSYPEMPNHAQRIAQQDQQQFLRIQQSHQNLKNKSLQKYLSRAERAEKDGNQRVARANYRRAIGIADQPLRSESILRMQQMLRQ